MKTKTHKFLHGRFQGHANVYLPPSSWLPKVQFLSRPQYTQLKQKRQRPISLTAGSGQFWQQRWRPHHLRERLTELFKGEGLAAIVPLSSVVSFLPPEQKHNTAVKQPFCNKVFNMKMNITCSPHAGTNRSDDKSYQVLQCLSRLLYKRQLKLPLVNPKAFPLCVAESTCSKRSLVSQTPLLGYLAGTVPCTMN